MLCENAFEQGQQLLVDAFDEGGGSITLEGSAICPIALPKYALS